MEYLIIGAHMNLLYNREHWIKIDARVLPVCNILLYFSCKTKEQQKKGS